MPHTPDDTDQPTPISPEVESLYAYMRARAIPTDADFLETAGIELAGQERIAQALGFTIPRALGLVINYPGMDYATVRLVPGGPRCPKGQTPCVYLPRWVHWPQVEGVLHLCESPLKAITWALKGFNALSAGGTTTLYMPGKQQWAVGFPHAAIESGAIHTVKIAFDSDTEGSNHNVSRDVRTLARALKDRHPNVTVKIHVLPPHPETGEDWGVDDAHAYHGDEIIRGWMASTEVDREPDTDPLQDHLDELNSQYIACLTPERVINLETGAMHNDSQFAKFVEGWRTVPGERRPVAVAPIWLTRRDRPTVRRMEYLPGEEKVVGESYNMWRPSPLIPRAGDVSPWLELIDDAVRCKETLKLMVECMAYQVQSRGQRLEKILYFVGREVGTGKSTQARIMKEIMGPANTGWVTKSELEGQYNACWAAKELVVLDDVEKLKRDTWSRLKTLVTSNEVTITEKYMPAWTQGNFAQIYVTANQADILATDADDRRVLMIHFEPTVLHRALDDPYWPAFHHWLNTGGYEAIAHYLATYDLGDFNPHFYPPASAIKAEAAESRMNDEEAFLVDFRERPYDFLPRGRQVVTSQELYTLFKGTPYDEFDKHNLMRMTKVVSAKQYLRRVFPERREIWGNRVLVYWVPGHEGRTPSFTAVRNQIKKLPLKLQE